MRKGSAAIHPGVARVQLLPVIEVFAVQDTGGADTCRS